ncbi:MAG: tyrosine--tRNA ligase [Rhizobacter sp.]|nr:tyrosine--tRNA ligase [Chlorobiales bacterium]
MPFPPLNEQLDLLTKNTAEIVPLIDLEKKIQHSINTDAPLKIKLGADPSRPDLHLGHAVVLRKLREFQELGHTAILIIGDFTAMIGDPSGKSKTRPSLSEAETRSNGKTYFDQASKILDREKTVIRYNSEWLGKMNFSEVIRLASKYTVAQMLVRDDFEKRYKSQEPISIHELLYPLAQAMDSVELQNDVELGGTDQKFNLLVARDIQREFGIAFPQVCMMMPILEGTDGVQKMSKSLDNYIGFNDTPAEMFGRTMSIPDAMTRNYFKLATLLRGDELASAITSATANPRDAKRRLAREIISMYHSREAAEAAQESFDRLFIDKQTPTDIETHTVTTEKISLVDALVQFGGLASKSEARRLIEQGGVSVDEEKITDAKTELILSGGAKTVKAGKRKFFRVTKK